MFSSVDSAEVTQKKSWCKSFSISDKMVNKKSNKELNEDIDCLKKKVNTLKNVTEDLLSKINKMLSEPKKSEQQNGKNGQHYIPPNLMLKCELCDYICAKKDEMKKHKIERHQEVCHKRCTICGKRFL